MTARDDHDDHDDENHDEGDDGLSGLGTGTSGFGEGTSGTSGVDTHIHYGWPRTTKPYEFRWNLGPGPPNHMNRKGIEMGICMSMSMSMSMGMDIVMGMGMSMMLAATLNAIQVCCLRS